MLHSLSEELYTKDLHFVLEFIQNADDNSYAPGVSPTLEFKLEGRLITIRCNETGFTPDNVQAICSVGKSTKKNLEGYIGMSGRALFFRTCANNTRTRRERHRSVKKYFPPKSPSHVTLRFQGGFHNRQCGPRSFRRLRVQV